ncbi:MAG TPA: isoprenylcysteine carboxylmethyltransferase family protein [Methyloceanibacter sp.]|nr:isoprenylcysteine carboxylmethyltransferase family protein [Methyloceanibacter sp.]
MTDDAADVAIKPPFLFLGALALGCLLSLILPIPPGLAQPNTLALAAGLTFVAIGFTLAALSVRRFQLAGTSVVPGEPSTALIVNGPYAFTRNPIYIGFVLAYFGLAIMLTSLWVLILLIPVWVILQRGVVEREESYLERQFDEPYRQYKARVPRWL